MDIVLASALFILVAGCVVGYSIRAETNSDRPAEPRRRRPFCAMHRSGSQLEKAAFRRPFRIPLYLFVQATL
jgi:hypothetical protein